MGFFRYLLLLLLLYGFSYGIIPAGTVISNTAKIEYEDETGFKYKDYSNTVSVIVKQVYGIDIQPDYQNITGFPDSNISIPFVLKNTGNGKDRYVINVQNRVDDDLDVDNLKVYIDSNENGIVDAGEEVYNNSNPPQVEPGGFIPLIVKGDLKSSGIYKIQLSGHSVNNPDITDQENIAEINVKPSFSLSVKKSVNKREVYPGENITFSINVENHGTQDITGNDIQTDFNNDSSPESYTGVLLEDKIPLHLSLLSVSKAPVNATVVYKGDNDNYWKDSLSEINGKLKYVGLLLDRLVPDQQERLTLTLKVDNDAPATTIYNQATVKTSKGDISSNIVPVKIKELNSIILDDTDDNDAFSGNNNPDDPDDYMLLHSMASGKGLYADFVNEAWNFSNKPQVINIKWDVGSSINVPDSAKVVFFDINGNPLTDTNNDGQIDLGIVKPGERVKFISRVYIPDKKYNDVVIAIKGSTPDGKAVDFTYDRIEDVQPATAIVKTTVSTGRKFTKEPLKRHRVVVYEYDNDGNRTDRPPVVLWTDDNGYILYDNDGNIKPLYNVFEYGKKYRLTIYGEYKGFSYYLSPFIQKSYFDQVNNTGEEKCWDNSGKNISCTPGGRTVKIRVLGDGTKELSLPLDPAGYVYDAITKEKIIGACVYFYRCSDASCNSYTLVDNDLLDDYSSGAGHQGNPQLTSIPYGAGGNNGTFGFIFKNFKPDLEGWYFLEVDFDCPGADKTLKNKYKPVRLQKYKEWKPEEGKPYRGEKFYIDENYPGTILTAIPMGGFYTYKLVVEKSVYPSVASIGDFVLWTISVKNTGTGTAYDVSVNDYLPRGFRYREGTGKVDGEPVEPEVSQNGRILTFKVGKIEPGKTKTVKFYTAVITSARDGKYKNIADALGYTDPEHLDKIHSNQGFAYIKITKGVFSDKGYIFGKVFIDQNKNKIHDENEPVIQGAKIYLDNGRYAVTDSEGKYHFDNLNPGTYVVKIDKTTIPEGAKLEILNTRNAGDPGSVFADVYPGDMHKVNFALLPFKPEMEIFKIRKRITGFLHVERGIEDVIIKPTDNTVKIKNYLLIKNKSSKPLYEINYTETSIPPQKGTVYINGSPFKDPVIKGSTFSWNIPVVLPDEKVKITWLSEAGKGKMEPEASISLKISPDEKGNQIPVNIPVSFGVIKDREYSITVYFPFGEYHLTPEAKKSLDRLISYLRKKKYSVIYIHIKGHTDAVRVINKNIKNNINLSFLRAEEVKNYLKKHLIDLKRVRIK